MASVRVLLFVVATVPLFAVSCGGSGSSSTSATPSAAAISTPSTEQRGEITRVLDAFAAADTPSAFCANITRGLESSIEQHGAAPTVSVAEAHQPASSNCPAVVTAATNAGDFKLTRDHVVVKKLLTQQDKAAALVTEAGHDRSYFLLDVAGRWFINNYGSAPPDFRDLNDAIQS